jgi:pyruvate dehydrogenase E2 component (dihydrolipoamide acetyltransferase)
MAELVMPRLSDTMEEGTILRWLKQDGDQVQRGDELVEIETDKANMIYQSDLDGALQTVAAEGDTLAVGALIAHIGDEGQGGDAAPGPSAAAAAQAAPEPSDEAFVEAIAEVAGGGDATDVPTPGGRVKASPLARRIARDRGVDLHALSGSGPGGRIVKADVEGAAAGATAAPPPARAPDAASSAAATPPAPPPAPAREDVTTAKGETTDVALTRMQQTIARRMAESKATIPDFTLLTDVDMQECVRLRAELKRMSKDDAPAPTYNDMVVKACALALREHPRANASYRDGALQLHSRINVGVAVAAQDALVVPTVFDADAKALGEIARETHALVERVRSGAITPPELGGGTFTVSNLGMFGIRRFHAVINPPQAAILAVGEVSRRPVVGEDGAIVARHRMDVALSCDHRVVYGAEAARFLQTLTTLLERPVALVAA